MVSDRLPYWDRKQSHHLIVAGLLSTSAVRIVGGEVEVAVGGNCQRPQTAELLVEQNLAGFHSEKIRWAVAVPQARDRAMINNYPGHRILRWHCSARMTDRSIGNCW